MTDAPPITKEERETLLTILPMIYSPDPRSPTALIPRYEVALSAAEKQIAELREALKPFAFGVPQVLSESAWENARRVYEESEPK